MSDHLPSRSQIRQAVRTVLERAIAGGGRTAPASASLASAAAPSAPAPAGTPVSAALGPAEPQGERSLVNASDVRSAGRGGVIRVAAGGLVTPLARDLAEELGVRFETSGGGAPAGGGAAPETPAPDVPAARPIAPGATIALGADHGGFELKEAIAAALAQRGYRLHDLGTRTKDSCDYPDYAAAVARAVALGESVVGIMVDGAGPGSCIVANKVPTVRAAACHDAALARNAREHNHANVLCLGSSVVSTEGALEVVDAFLATAWGAGRYARRNLKVDAVEAAFVGGRP